MTVAVTAASGRLGAEVVRALIALEGHTVIGLARTPSKAQHLGVEIRRGDYESPAELKTSLKGVDALLLVSGMDEPAKRIEQHRNVIRAAGESGVRKIVYTSVQGAETGTAFSPVVQSNRRTEQDVRDSGLEWIVGRNGIYIEPDVEYIDRYREDGAIRNCAGDARCGYTTRPELAAAYARLLTTEGLEGRTLDLNGEPITQSELADHLNRAFDTDLRYEPMSVEEYRADRVAELGDFLGGVIAGIYEGIRQGAHDRPGHFREAAGREHRSWDDYFHSLRLARSDP